MSAAVGVIRSPNIWDHPAIYELENRAVDPEQRLWAAMRDQHDWAGQAVLDIGCGTGFYLPKFAVDAAHVTGVEPHRPLLSGAKRRTASLPRVRVVPGTAQNYPFQTLR